MVGIKEYLDDCFRRSLSGLVQEKRLEKVNETTSGVGALLDYKCENFLLRISNDRGCVTIELLPNSDQSPADVSLIGELVSPDLYKDKEGVVRLSLEEQAKLLTEKWDQLQNLYSPKNYKETEKKLKELDLKRSKKTLPKQQK